MYKINDLVKIVGFLKEQNGEPKITTQHLQTHAYFDCGCKVVSDINKKSDYVFPCDKHKTDIVNINIPKNVSSDDYLFHGFKSSLIDFPPYKTPIKMLDSVGKEIEVVLHESEDDGYNFNERPMRMHLIMLKGENFRWKLL